MLERIQDRSLLSALTLDNEECLHGAARALAQWAIVDDYDNILDLQCRDGKLLNYLSRRYSLRACGIADDPEQAKMLRQKMPDAEVFYARKEDIPWRSNAWSSAINTLIAILCSYPHPIVQFAWTFVLYIITQKVA
mgnify:CR=1 FL=1